MAQQVTVSLVAINGNLIRQGLPSVQLPAPAANTYPSTTLFPSDTTFPG